MSLATLQSRPANDAKPSRIVIEPVTPIIGAEISGVDLTRPLDAETFAEIRQAIRKWRVIFFRDQDITNEQLKTFGRYFGPLTPAHPISEGLDDHPEIWERAVDEYRVRRSENDNLKPGARKPRDYKGWHIDITFVANPNAYSLLYGVQIPEYGGDTLFANTAAAYADLPEHLRLLADRAWAEHSNEYDYAEHPQFRSTEVEEYHKVFVSTRYRTAHPVVRVNPDSGVPNLFIGNFVTGIIGLSKTEGRDILRLLQHYVTRPENTLRHKWQVGDIVVWDNRSTQHYAADDYGDLARKLHRVTVAGDVPVSLDGTKSYILEGDEATHYTPQVQ